jgi:hypothetical protein
MVGSKSDHPSSSEGTCFVVEVGKGCDVTHSVIFEDGSLLGVMECPHECLEFLEGHDNGRCIGRHGTGDVNRHLFRCGYIVEVVDIQRWGLKQNKITCNPDSFISLSKTPTGLCFEFFFCCLLNVS